MNEQINEEKYNFVIEWLSGKYEKIPPFEVNNKTIEILYNLAQKNLKRNKMMQEMIDDLNKRSDEYIEEGNKTQKVLRMVGLSNDFLLKKGIQGHKMISSLALSLGLKDVGNTSILLAIEELFEELESKQEQKEKMEKIHRNLTEISKKQLERLNEMQILEKEYSNQQSSQMIAKKTKQKSVEYLENKKREYENTLDQLKQSIHTSQFNPELMHKKLLNIYEELIKIQKESVPIHNVLSAYKDLPPDLSLAKLKIHEAKENLSQEKEKFSNLVNNLQLNN